MRETLKNLALITTGLVVGVVIRRVGKSDNKSVVASELIKDFDFSEYKYRPRNQQLTE